MNYEQTIELLNLLDTNQTRKIAQIIEEGIKGLYVILKLIRNAPTPIIAKDIALKLNISTARVTKALNSLELKHYIKKYPDDIDKRKIYLQLTEQGSIVLKKREEEIAKVLVQMLKNLDDKDLKNLKQIINKIQGVNI